MALSKEESFIRLKNRVERYFKLIKLRSPEVIIEGERSLIRQASDQILGLDHEVDVRRHEVAYHEMLDDYTYEEDGREYSVILGVEVPYGAYPLPMSRGRLMNKYFGIDDQKISEEKNRMLEQIREQYAKTEAAGN
jgi:hypothetical protein